uniref:SLPTX16 n=1 Tax=Scolopendra viridis TaxID=118503 RepID=A0A4D5R9A1_SCOVI
MGSFSIIPVICLVLIFTISSFYGMVSEQEVESKNGNCLLHDGTEHAVGETWYGDNCMVYECEKNSDNEYSVVGRGCAPFYAGPGCHSEEGTDGNYPDCCPQQVCDEE